MKNFCRLFIIFAVISGLVWNSQPIMHSIAQTDSALSPAELLDRMKVNRWHNKGYDGSDIVVGVIAASFPNELLIAELWDTKIKFCETPPSNPIADTFSEQVAQMLYTLNVFSPGATIYFQPVSDPQDYSTAIECFKKQNVKIIVNYSGFFQYIYRADEIEQYISQTTIENDFLWLFAAGNYGRSFYESPKGIRPVGATNSPQHNFGTSPDTTPMMEIVASEASAQRSEVILHFVWQVPQNKDTQILHDQVQINVYRTKGASCAEQGVENELLDPVFNSVSDSWDIPPYSYFLNVYYAAKPGDRLCIELMAGLHSTSPITTWPFTLFVDNADIVDQRPTGAAGNSIVPPNNSDIGLTVGALDDDGKAIAAYSSSNTAGKKPNLYSYGTLTLSDNIPHVQGTRFSVAIVAGIAASYWDRYDDTRTAADIRQMILEDTDNQHYLLSARDPVIVDGGLGRLGIVVSIVVLLCFTLAILIGLFIRDRQQVLRLLRDTRQVRADYLPGQDILIITYPFAVRKHTGFLRVGRHFRLLELRINVSPRPRIFPLQEHLEVQPCDGELSHGISWALSIPIRALAAQVGIERLQGHKAVTLDFHPDTLFTVKMWLNYRFAEGEQEDNKNFAILLKRLEFADCPQILDIDIYLDGRIYHHFPIHVQNKPQQKSPIVITPQVFLSYRRDDTLPETFNLYRELTARLGEGRVFMDLFGITPGALWEKVLEDRLSTCKVALVIIGNQWLGITDSTGQRRLDNKEDIVRKEVVLALNKIPDGLKVIPVLVEGTDMPLEAQLPKPLKKLTERNAISIGIAHFDQDMEDLIKAMNF